MVIIFITNPKTLSTKTKLSEFNFSETKILYCLTKVLPKIPLRAEWFGAERILVLKLILIFYYYRNVSVL